MDDKHGNIMGTILATPTLAHIDNLCSDADTIYIYCNRVLEGVLYLIKTELIFILVAFLISLLHRKNYKWDCIAGELLGIGFLIILSYMAHKYYGLIYFEPMRVMRVMILGYLPGRVISWW